MSDVKQFLLPDVGEGLTEAEIVSWKVKAGDTVKVNDVIVEIETAKSLVELPCPFAGVVDGLLVEEGETVPVGTPIIAVRVGGAGGAPAAAPAAPAAAPAGEARAQAGGETLVGGPAEDLVPAPKPGGERQAVLVGYGPRTGATTRRPRKSAPGHAAAAEAGVREAFSTAAPVSRPVAPPGPARPVVPVPQEPGPSAARLRVLAKPPVRKLAKDLGVDLGALVPSGPGGTVTREDVQSAADGGAPAVAAGTAGAQAAAAGTGWDGGPREERVAIRSVRKHTAANVTRSAFTAPHVTEFVTVDVTRTMRLVDRLRTSREFREVRLSPLTLLARALCVAVRRTPEVNATWDDEAQEIVLKRYVNLGIASATPRGLMVPNVKDAHLLDLRGLADAINALVVTAREGRTPPSDMAGGTISITNVGVFGVDTGTPILPPGESAIVCFGAVREQPWVHKGKVRPRMVTTLGLSFDHRLVDGEQGSRFLADLAALLEDPAQALAWA
ncbi:MAG TPA: dihydrolipoamide acetyltransferase family protein [Jiangellales bacterium]|nr:dihydrolipoamide acetyltransferase family protein [Jiangellales bacterium]